MTTQDVTLPLKQAYDEFGDLILSLSDVQFLSSMSGWSPRDVVAHLIGWNGLMIESSLSILDGKLPAYYDDAPNDYSQINAGFTAKYSSESKQELLAELKSSFERLIAFVHGLSAEELTADHGVVHHSGIPATVAKIIQSLAGDYQYHTKEIQEWLRQ